MLDSLPWAGRVLLIPGGSLMTGGSVGGEPATPEPSYSLTPFMAGWHGGQGGEMRLIGYVAIQCPWKASEGLGCPALGLYRGWAGG